MGKYRQLIKEPPMRFIQEEDPKDKGMQNGHCNRSACLSPGANWFNHSTKKWYCAGCALRINEANPEFKREMGYSICTTSEREE